MRMEYIWKDGTSSLHTSNKTRIETIIEKSMTCKSIMFFTYIQ